MALEQWNYSAIYARGVVTFTGRNASNTGYTYRYGIGNTWYSTDGLSCVMTLLPGSYTFMMKGQTEIAVFNGAYWVPLFKVYNTGYVVSSSGVGQYREDGNHVVFNERITSADDVYASTFYNFDSGVSEVLTSGYNLQELWTAGLVTLTVRKPVQVTCRAKGMWFDSDYTYEQSRTQDPQTPYDMYVAIQTVDTVPMLFGDTSVTQRQRLATNGHTIVPEDGQGDKINYAHSDHWREINIH